MSVNMLFHFHFLSLRVVCVLKPPLVPRHTYLHPADRMIQHRLQICVFTELVPQLTIQIETPLRHESGEM